MCGRVALCRARDHGVMTVMDVTWPSDGVWLPKIEAALPYTDIFMPSRYEAEMFAGSSEPDEIIAFLHDRGVRIAGVKLGAEGVAVEDFRLPAYDCPPGELRDTCGAGDAFNAGFLCGITEEKSIRDCAVLGSAAANFCIRASGATAGVADRAVTEAFIRRMAK
jgi:sugar/nucleoside kinase (ribokinase family)